MEVQRWRFGWLNEQASFVACGPCPKGPCTNDVSVFFGVFWPPPPSCQYSSYFQALPLYYWRHIWIITPPSYQRWWQQNRESSLSWKTIMRRKAVLLFSLACCHTCLQFTYLNSKLFTPKQPHLEVPEHSGGGSRYDVSLSFYPPPLPIRFCQFFGNPLPPTSYWRHLYMAP